MHIAHVYIDFTIWNGSQCSQTSTLKKQLFVCLPDELFLMTFSSRCGFRLRQQSKLISLEQKMEMEMQKTHTEAQNATMKKHLEN